ncbi:MAG: MerR family transcriptional regulator, partial [Desulfovibrio sp.]|nr:MerR family transcriptional regulator [Desulfovibrio sp.]
MPEKTYRIGEAAELLNLKSYVLRFWETEFPQLAPLRTEKGQRLYSEEHLALLRRIKQLLHEQGMTIDGARRVLEGSAVVDRDSPDQLRAVPDKAFLM